MRTMQEILNLMIDEGFYSDTERGGSEYMCFALKNAELKGLITEKEYTECIKKIGHYLYVELAVDYAYLANALRNVGLPYDKEYITALYRDWENRPMPTRSRKETLTKQLEEVLKTTEEIKTELQNIEIGLFETGQRVYSPMLGEGVVTRIDTLGDYPISVKFDATGNTAVFTRRGLRYRDDSAPTIYPYPVKIVPSEEVAEEKSDDVNFEVGDEVYCTIAGKGRIVRVDRNGSYTYEGSFADGHELHTAEGKYLIGKGHNRTLFKTKPKLVFEDGSEYLLN